MKNIIIILSIISLYTFSCKNGKKNTDEKKSSGEITVTDSIGKQLFEKNCLACHSHEGKTESTMIAPPFFAIKRQYLRFSMDEKDFIETMTHWVKNPSEENVLMRGALGNFDVMPYMPFPDEDIDKIVHYIYQVDFEKPEWFDAHEATHRRMGKRGMNANHSHN